MAVNTPYKKSTATTTNHTANYDLPLWAGEDTTSWLTQMNDAMNKIDDGMVDAKSKALEVVGIAADAKKLAEETKAESAASAQIVAGYNDRLTAAEEKIVEHTQDITNLNTRSDQFDVELHSVQEVQRKTTADLATLAAKVDTNKSDVDAKITANTEEIARTNANVATVSGKVTALETEVGEVSRDTQTNTNAINAINTAIEGINTKDTEQDGKITANTTEISSLDGRVTALEEGGSGDIAEKKYNISNSVFNIRSITQGLRFSPTATANLTIKKKNGIYIFNLSTAIAPKVDSASGTDNYAEMTVEMNIGTILTDFPELANLTNNIVPNLVASGIVLINGNVAPAVISGIYFTESKCVFNIEFAALEISVTGTRSFNPIVRGFAIV